MRKIKGLDIFRCRKDRLADIGIEGFEVANELFDTCSVGFALERTQFWDTSIAGQLGIAIEVTLVAKAQRTDETERHFLHLQHGRNGTERPLEDEVHEKGLDDIVFVMAKGNLVAAEFLRHGKKSLSAVPGAEETGVLLLVARRIFRIANEEIDPLFSTESTQIIDIGLVADISNPHMDGGHAETRYVDTKSAAEKFDQSQGIFATGQAHKDMIAISNEAIIGTAFVETLGQAILEAGELYLFG